MALLADYWRPGWRAGGPITSLGLLVDRTKAHVAVFTRNHDLGSRQPYSGIATNEWTHRADARSPTAYLTGWRGITWALRELRRMQPQILHINSLHSPLFGILPLATTRLGLIRPPYVLISPHGELSAASQQHKKWKKSLARPLLRGLVSRRIVWHASSAMEFADIEAWLGRTPHTIVAPDSPPAPRSNADAFHDARSLPTVLFASRIHPIKGLDTAIAMVARVKTPCRFVIAGPIEDDSYWQQCQQLLAQLPRHIDVVRNGPYQPSELDALIDAARVLVLPTKGENFGQVIAEALSRGCPVVIPPTTPWLGFVGPHLGCVFESETAGADFLEQVVTESGEQAKERRRRTLSAYREWCEEVSAEDIYAQALEVRT